MSARRAAFAIALLAAALVTGCAGPFVGRGHDGVDVDRLPPVDRTVQANGDNNVPPHSPVCGRTVVVSARARQRVADCANVDYGPLYRRASEQAARLAAGMRCPAMCFPPRWAESARVWHCSSPGAGAPIFATATVEHDAVCPWPPGAPLPAPDPPTAGQLSQPLGALADLSGQPGLIEDVGEGAVLGCPGRQVVQFDYEETAPATCRRRRFDYEPYVLQATFLAARHYETYSCAPGCVRKDPFATIRREWGCQPADLSRAVQVRVWFEVLCVVP